MHQPVSAKLRIVHCFRSPVGGIFRHVRDLTEAQVAAGHSVGIVCDSTTGGDHEERLFDAVRPMLALGVHRTPMQRHVGLGDLTAAWRSYKIIKELQPNVLHGHGAKGGAYSRAFGSLLRVSRSRVARIYSPHGGSLHYDEKTTSGKAFFALERLMERFTDHLLFVSDYERRTFVRKIGEPRAANSLVYNGLQEAEFEPVPSQVGAADFLYIGMMRDLKGPDLFIEAISAIRRQAKPGVIAIMVGDGQDLPRYRAQVDRLGLAAQVQFRPAMPARAAFALADCVVVPSRAEAMPYIVLETLAAQKPIVATAVGGIPEILGSASPALVRPDAGELAGKMSAFLEAPAQYARAMPDTQELKSRFSVAVMAENIERAYRSALSPLPLNAKRTMPTDRSRVS
ncbi:glycosyltransferase family 4 protein [Aminobacter sp. HY435]|uniref:glycosyltransferase family 4 protein n=1 Tax=Aminobacter sp. HY435 TaxID=2970917 RepID=UPI0022B977DA|nr:glycosyltransferase family 4 protein [Aminobacter sp. HY435]